MAPAQLVVAAPGIKAPVYEPPAQAKVKVLHFAGALVISVHRHWSLLVHDPVLPLLLNFNFSFSK